jgi:hypothetical protein
MCQHMFAKRAKNLHAVGSQSDSQYADPFFLLRPPHACVCHQYHYNAKIIFQTWQLMSRETTHNMPPIIIPINYKVSISTRRSGSRKWVFRARPRRSHGKRSILNAIRGAVVKCEEEGRRVTVARIIARESPEQKAARIYVEIIILLRLS